ncbi:hypothetical protein [Halorubrum sp. PV6]|uniref:hypothetical protein n=1 Tax=Halorubrum sp. PV6 TaxID=634157 RepID=UPI000F8C561E|nr:hypothetical protein [Halorubrum sp. PV6]
MEITEVTESNHAPSLEIEVRNDTDDGQIVVRFAYITPPNSGPELRRFYTEPRRIPAPLGAG